MKRALAAVRDTGAAPGSSTKASFQIRKEMRARGFFFHLIVHTTRNRRDVGCCEREREREILILLKGKRKVTLKNKKQLVEENADR